MKQSLASRLVAALVLLPLLLVAYLVTLGDKPASPLDAQAAELGARLDQSLQRSASDSGVSVALLPFEIEAGLQAQDHLAAGSAAELRRMLAQVPDLHVIGAQSSAQVAEQPLSLQSKALLLGVDWLVTGSLRGGAEVLEFELRLQQPLKPEVSAHVQRFPASVAQLGLAISSMYSYLIEQLLARSAMAAQAELPVSEMASYLQALALIQRDNTEDILEGVVLLDLVIAAHPQFAPAYEAKMRAHERMTWVNAELMAEHYALRNQTVQAYMALGIDSALRRRILAVQAGAQGQLIERFLAYQHARQVFPKQFAYHRGAMFDLCRAGYSRRCVEQARGLARLEPLSGGAHVELANAHFVEGNLEAMRRHAELAGELGASMGDYLRGLERIWRQDWDAAAPLLRRGLEQLGLENGWLEAYLRALQDPASIAAAVAELEATGITTRRWMDHFHGAMITLGQMDRAYQISEQLIEEQAETWSVYLWQPDFAAFRADPRFIGLVEKLGLPGIWRSLGPPDICERRPAESFCLQLGLVPG